LQKIKSFKSKLNLWLETLKNAIEANMKKFKKLKRIIKMVQKTGKGLISKKYALITRLYQPYINWTGDQIDIDGILDDREKKPVIFSEGL